MKLFTTAAALALAFTLAFAPTRPAFAQPAAVDEDIATTPTDLAELLGPDGLEGVAIESRLKLRTEDFDVAGVECTRIFGEDNQLVITMRKREGPSGMARQRHVFSAGGLLVESRSVGASIDYETVKATVREDDQVRLTRAFTPTGEDSQTEEVVVAYQPAAGTIPTVWLSIAIAYHLREGHTRFVLRFSDDYSGRDRFVQTYHVVDSGVEEIDVCGESRETHVLAIRLGIEMDGQPMDLGPAAEGDSFRMHVLPDGSIARFRMETRGFVVSAEAITTEEAEELLAAGGGDGAGEDIEDAGGAVRDAAE